MKLTLVLPGAVDCSLAVTNNSPLCFVILLSFPFCKPFNWGKIQASKCRAVFNYYKCRDSNYLNSQTNRYCTIWRTWAYEHDFLSCSLAMTNNSSVYLLIFLWLYVLLIYLTRTVYTRAFKYRVIFSVIVSRKCGFHELANKSTLYNTMTLRFRLYIIYV